VIDEAFNRGNLAEIDKHIAATYIYHGPDGLEIRGPEGFKQMVNMYRAAFPDMQVTLEDVIAEGDKVVTRFKARGTHKGSLMGSPRHRRP
jgi:predicted ester cyclase